MNISDILKLPLQSINNVSFDAQIESVYISDLLSFVIANAKEGALWLTVQKHLNVIAVAQLNDFAGIIFVQDSYPDEDVIKKASELDIPLFVTHLPAYEMAKELMMLGL